MPDPFDRFIHQKTVRLTTYRRNGTPVGTPVHIAVEGEHAYFRTFDAAWKAKRMRNNPGVEVAPSTANGKPTGPAQRATARLLEGEESARAGRLLAQKYPIVHGWVVPLIHKLKKHRTLHYELSASITP